MQQQLIIKKLIASILKRHQGEAKLLGDGRFGPVPRQKKKKLGLKQTYCTWIFLEEQPEDEARWLASH